NNIFVISDEIYEKLVYDGETHVSIASLGDDIKALTIVINGMSKTYAMTGWRIGYAAAKEEVIAVMKNIQSHSTSNANSIAQYASIAALECAEQTINDAVDMFNTRRKILVEQINNIPGLSCIVPKGAFYIMVNIKDILGTKYKGSIIKDSLTFCD